MRIDMLEEALAAYGAPADESLGARLRFLEGLTRIQSEAHVPVVPYRLPRTETAREGLLTGQPLFLAAPPAIPREEYVATVNLVAGYVADEAGLDQPQSEALRAVDFGDTITDQRLSLVAESPDKFVADVIEAVGASESAELKPATVAYVAASALVPFLTGPAKQATQALGPFDRSSWTLATCPVCGSPATMGYVGERNELKGGERALWCGLCHTEWAFERLKCARCGNRSTDKLRYVHLEDDPARRLHLCEACHGYLRVIFTDELAVPLSMVVEDAVTATLDAVAHAEGYSPYGNEGSTQA